MMEKKVLVTGATGSIGERDCKRVCKKWFLYIFTTIQI